MTLALLALLLLAFLLACVFEWVPVEVAALGLVVALAVTGILTAEQAVAGFGSPVVLAIAGLRVMNAAIDHWGLVAWLGRRLAAVAVRSPRRALLRLLALTGGLSAFVSDVATTALLMPAVIATCRRASISPSRFLMPLAFVSLVGGMGTLIGATGNLIVQGMIVQAGVRPFGFFEFTLVGAPMLAVALCYLLTVGWRLVPDRRPPEADVTSPLRGYLVEVAVPDGSTLAGQTVAESHIRDRFGLTLLAIQRGTARIVAPGPGERLAAGDRLIVEGGAEGLGVASGSGALATAHDAKVAERDLESADIHLYEALVSPRSTLVGRTARGRRLRERWGLTLLAVLRHGTAIRPEPARVRLEIGDELLLQGPGAAVTDLERDGELILLDRASRRTLSGRGLWLPVAALLGVVLLPAFGVMHLSIAALLAATVLIASRTLAVDQALRALDLKVVIVVACVLPLGRAVESAGGVEPLTRVLQGLHGATGPWAVLAALFLVTTALVQVMQKAAIALAVPLALAAAQATDSSPAPFCMAVAIAGSCAFLSPLAHPVNLIVHGPGHYRFGDYWRAGLPLQLLLSGVALILIPLFWPFVPR